MNPIQTVITAAGDSRSMFLNAGFTTPKSLVERDGKVLLLRAIESYVVNPDTATVAINSEEQVQWPIRETIHGAYPTLKVVEIPSSVKGALASALVAMDGLDEDLPLVVAAGDSEVSGGISDSIGQLTSEGYAAGTVVFPSDNPRLSYLAIDAHGQVLQVAEKRIIGPLATTGVFYFSSASLFLEAAEWCLVNSACHDGSYYVSTALNYIVKSGLPVGYSTISPAEYLPGGLPVDFTRGVNQ